MKFIPLILFLVLGVIFWRGLQLDPHVLPSALINKPVPRFSLGDLSEADFKNHVSLLNVFATWCVNCHLEHPVLMDMSTDHVMIYGLAYKDSPEKIKAWLKEAGNPYEKIGFDEKGAVGINLGVYGTPETFVIDARGIIRYKHVGPVTEEVWLNEVKPEVERLQK